MQDFTTFFKGKKITVMGIDPEGRGVQDALFAATHGAQVVATDMKSEESLGDSPELLRAAGITLVLGEHKEEDFTNTDLVLRAASAPLGSPFLQAAKKANVRIETDETLFFALAPRVTCIGVTGTRGKTTTTHLIYDIVFRAYPNATYIAGNVRGIAALPLLEKIKEGDMVVMELSSWQLQQFGENNMSPSIAVFTTFLPDHLNYYGGSMDAYLDDKAQIFLHQKSDDTLVLGAQALPSLEKYKSKIQSRVVIADVKKFPKAWKLHIPGEHNKANAICAIEAARALGIDEEVICQVVENFKGVPGRLELVREVDGIKIYNDTTATTPDATIAALEALDPENKKNILLIMGGADKGLDMTALQPVVHAHAKEVFFLTGTGTDRVRGSDPVFNSLKEVVTAAMAAVTMGDIILFSPAFASFGMFTNEYDRGDQFNALVKNL